MRLVAEALAATGEERSAALLLGAEEGSTRSGIPYGADARRLAELRGRLEASLGSEALEAVLAEGGALSDEAAVDEALQAVARAAAATR